MSDVLRRDPRAEWIARNRLHPLHAALQPRLERWMGPNGVLRKNVHGGGLSARRGLSALTAVAASKAGRPGVRSVCRLNGRCIRCRALRSTSPSCPTCLEAA